MGKIETNAWHFIVNLLPKKLVYFCFIRVMAYATTGKYNDTVVPKLSGMDAVKRYGEDFNIE